MMDHYAESPVLTAEDARKLVGEAADDPLAGIRPHLSVVLMYVAVAARQGKRELKWCFSNLPKQVVREHREELIKALKDLGYRHSTVDIPYDHREPHVPPYYDVLSW